ncbi:MAG: hypothetical protein HKN07_10985 [Acidimicrobiia bacterium]|nr:hypothetical protein [Acidimicrobiia bacterium]
MSDLGRRVAEAIAVAYLALAPSEIPAHRYDPNGRPAAVLQVGEPVVALTSRAKARSASA